MTSGGSALQLPVPSHQRQFRWSHHRTECYEKDKGLSNYEETGASEKGIVSALTNLVNLFLERKQDKEESSPIVDNNSQLQLPRTPSELMARIRDDYVIRNYLWTGDIDLVCFDERCRFKDPTLSFESRDTFVRNTKNLKVLVDKLATNTRSDLLELSVTDEYVESRWNMVGDLTGIPWTPRIDVIGRTKFWYKRDANGGLAVYFYDESWEMPAGKALLQLITPAGTISS